MHAQTAVAELPGSAVVIKNALRNADAEAVETGLTEPAVGVVEALGRQRQANVLKTEIAGPAVEIIKALRRLADAIEADLIEAALQILGAADRETLPVKTLRTKRTIGVFKALGIRVAISVDTEPVGSAIGVACAHERLDAHELFADIAIGAVKILVALPDVDTVPLDAKTVAALPVFGALGEADALTFDTSKAVVAILVVLAARGHTGSTIAGFVGAASGVATTFAVLASTDSIVLWDDTYLSIRTG